MRRRLEVRQSRDERERGRDAPKNREDLAHLPDRQNLVLDRRPPLRTLLVRKLLLRLDLLALDSSNLLLNLLLLLVELLLAADTEHGDEHVGDCDRRAVSAPRKRRETEG